MELLRDPIIETYLNLLKNSKEAAEMPVFSETLLRFAFRHIFGKYRCINASELEMYRKLLLYYYAEEYTDVEVLTQIMTCYTEDEIHEAIEESDTVMLDWKNFVEHELMPDALIQTYKLIISEWSKRYKVKHGEISFDLLKSKATELQKMLNYNEGFIEKFIKKRRNKLIFPLLEPQAFKVKWSDNDLSFTKIITDLLTKISPLVRKKVRSITLSLQESEEVSASKRVKVDVITEITKTEPVENVAEKAAIEPKIQPVAAEEPIKTNKQPAENIKKNVKQIPVTENESSSDEIFEIMEICSSDEDQDTTTTTTEAPPLAYPPAPPTKTISAPTAPTQDTQDSEEEQFVTKIITLSTALSYITEVHAFALVNGYNDVSELMQRVTEVLRTKEED